MQLAQDVGVARIEDFIVLYMHIFTFWIMMERFSYSPTQALYTRET